ncbi:non-homologous end-joining DNA ligase [Sphingosinicella sp. LY1275]|uniref:non-homologous end-joining DNA ligase n=1 Tax=Sphingosinicella sp. LY1275 TaxID=3095379 RepID=UPI002ADEAF22|nr:non-homologous end-joining DNA ligase [Sphingosinicella sp. LY1275]MEA1015876.1 non-homologous end-joining DNA ligase [Sphingosinicella sp. LY1275]
MSERIVEGVRLSNPDKILYPDQGITKGELADYYCAVADRMLPHVARRPVTMVRCPTGQEKKCFYQRHAGSGVPEQLREVNVPGFDEPYLYLEDVAGLIAMVQMGVLEIHPWGVTVERPDRPDRVIFDLDPAEGLDFGDVVRAALEVRDRLDGLGLESFVKTTGGKGLHVVVPIDPVADWKRVKGFAKSLSERMAADAPDRYLTKISKAERVGRIFIDYLRNDPTSTAVAPYSTRSRPGAPVALPLEWDELDDSLAPAEFTIRTVPKRVAGSKDPWAAMDRVKQKLPEA